MCDCISQYENTMNSELKVVSNEQIVFFLWAAFRNLKNDQIHKFGKGQNQKKNDRDNTVTEG